MLLGHSKFLKNNPATAGSLPGSLRSFNIYSLFLIHKKSLWGIPNTYKGFKHLLKLII